MDRFTILCTEEQARKAISLGAPISTTPTDLINNTWFKVTAEQMIGWLRTKGFAFGITEYNDGFNDHVFWRVANNQETRWYISDDKLKDPKEAVIAAIDAALDYLAKIMEEKL